MKTFFIMLLALAAFSACAIPAIGSGYEREETQPGVVAEVVPDPIKEPVTSEQQSVIYRMKIDGID